MSACMIVENLNPAHLNGKFRVRFEDSDGNEHEVVLWGREARDLGVELMNEVHWFPPTLCQFHDDCTWWLT